VKTAHSIVGLPLQAGEQDAKVFVVNCDGHQHGRFAL